MWIREEGEAMLRELTAEELTALELRGWTVARVSDANPPDGAPCDSYVLTRSSGRVDLAPCPTFEDDVQALLDEPLPPAPIPVQARVAEALHALQAQPTISGADLASVISALTGEQQ
jgi:hypothetical protein